MKTVTLKIQRFDPDKEQRPCWTEYRVSVENSYRLLDTLHTIKWEQDISLTFLIVAIMARQNAWAYSAIGWASFAAAQCSIAPNAACETFPSST